MTLEAHYFTISAAEKRTNPGARGVLKFARTENGHRVWLGDGFAISPRYVTGKVEARKLAKQHDATPWNF